MEAYVNAVIEEHYHTLPLSVKALGGGFYGRVFLAVLPEAPFRVVIKLYLYPGLALQEETSPESDALRKMLLATLLLELKDLCRQQQEQGGENGRVSNHIVDQIQAYIAEHYAEKLTLTGIASQFYISPYYLSRLFKKSINLSLIEYINGVRIKAAQNLIEKSNESISDIAEKTGFLTTAHFRRVFKDATGLSPQQYRQYYKRVNK